MGKEQLYPNRPKQNGTGGTVIETWLKHPFGVALMQDYKLDLQTYRQQGDAEVTNSKRRAICRQIQLRHLLSQCSL